MAYLPNFAEDKDDNVGKGVEDSWVQPLDGKLSRLRLGAVGPLQRLAEFAPADASVGPSSLELFLAGHTHWQLLPAAHTLAVGVEYRTLFRKGARI